MPDLTALVALLHLATKDRRQTEPDQSWKTFLHNHMSQAAACDFFVVPTVTFQRLYFWASA